MVLRVGWLARIPLCFWAHTDLTDPTVLLCGWEISQMLLRVGWLARIPLCFWAHTDLTDPTVLLCGWEISQMILRVGCAHADSAWFLGSHGSHRSHGIALWVGNLTDDSVGGKSHRWLCGCGLLGTARGSLSRTYLLDPSDKSDLSDKSDGLDIFKNNP